MSGSARHGQGGPQEAREGASPVCRTTRRTRGLDRTTAGFDPAGRATTSGPPKGINRAAADRPLRKDAWAGRVRPGMVRLSTAGLQPDACAGCGAQGETLGRPVSHRQPVAFHMPPVPARRNRRAPATGQRPCGGFHHHAAGPPPLCLPFSASPQPPPAGIPVGGIISSAWTRGCRSHGGCLTALSRNSHAAVRRRRRMQSRDAIVVTPVQSRPRHGPRYIGRRLGNRHPRLCP